MKRIFSSATTNHKAVSSWPKKLKTHQSFTLYILILLSVLAISCNNNDNAADPNNTSPSAPRDLSVHASSNKTLLFWTPPNDNGSSPLTGYNIYRGLSTGSQTFLISVSAPSISYTDSSLTNGTKYYYYITAINNAGEGDKSNEAFATPMPAPSVPRNVKLIPTNYKVHILWDSPLSDGGSPVIAYSIYKGISPNDLSYHSTIDAIAYPKYFIDSAVTNNNIYYYSLSASNTNSESILTTPLTAMPLSHDINGRWELVKMEGNLQDVCLGEIAVFNSGTAALTCPGASTITRTYTYANKVLAYTASGISYGISFTAQNGIFKLIMRGTGIERTLTYNKLYN